MRYLLLALIVFTVVVGLLARPPKSPKVGDKAPAFSVTTMEGKTFKSSELVGKGPVLIVFIGHTCPISKRVLPHYDKLAAYLEESGISRYMVLDADAEAARRFLQKQKPKFTILLDPKQKAFRAFGLTSAPASTVLAGDGKVAQFDHGLSREILAGSARRIYDLVGEKPPVMDFSSVPERRQVG